MDDQRLKQLLSEAKTIAVVGVSDNPNKTANQIAEYLLRVGYTVIPVNPMLEEWNGRKAYPSVESIPGRIDIVDVFRRSEFLAGVAEDAVRHGDVGLVFNQLGLSSACTWSMLVYSDKTYLLGRSPFFQLFQRWLTREACQNR